MRPDLSVEPPETDDDGGGCDHLTVITSVVEPDGTSRSAHICLDAKADDPSIMQALMSNVVGVAALRGIHAHAGILVPGRDEQPREGQGESDAAQAVADSLDAVLQAGLDGLNLAEAFRDALAARGWLFKVSPLPG